MTSDALEMDLLVETAAAATGLDDFSDEDSGDDDWREGLSRLVGALDEEARLNELGEQIAAGEIVTLLANRLQLIAWRCGHPEIAGADIVPPIVIVGQGRTGTTILFDILAQDPTTRVPLTWEVDRPMPPPETATFDADPRIDEVDELLAGTDVLIPGFRTIHPMGARLSQECVRMTASAFRSITYPTQYRVPSYGQWMMYEADMAPAYRWHRHFLQHLQSRHPAGGSGAARWLLKSPAHIWCLDALLAEYPDAFLVQTHRDPLSIIASLSSLEQTLRSMTCDDPTIPEIADEWADYILDGLDRSVTAREDGTVRPDRVVDVTFREFMASPFGVIRDIYAGLDLELTRATERRMGDFLAAHSRPEEGRHQYSFAATGLDAGEIRERSRRYQEHFDVPSEAP
ncbi:MAG: sulfotransferase family protein [Acidimicrobiia bacterium]